MRPFAINRRGFLAGVGILAATPAVAATVPMISRPTVYLAESGKYGTWPRVFGLLATPRPATHAAAIELIRRRAGYPRELRYMSTDRGKIGFARAVIDYFAAQPDLKFSASIVSADAGVRMNEASLRARVFGKGKAEPQSIANLAQLARFLTGCVHGSATGVRHAVKAELIRYLEERVSASPQASRFTIMDLGKNNTG